jgi:hypothetical protein
MDLPPVDGAQYRGTIGTYRAAAEHVAADVGVPSAAREIVVTDDMPQRGARAIADGRTGQVLIARGEADAFEALTTQLARDGAGMLDQSTTRDLGQRMFTALHEASHLTGPVIPDANPHMKLDLMWEEGLASLNARRLLPSFARQHAALDVPRPPIADITYSGYAERLGELLDLAGAPRDTPAFDAGVRELAEQVPWRERPSWVARRVLEARSGAASADDIARLEPHVHSYVQRMFRGTGAIERELAEILARIVA